MSAWYDSDEFWATFHPVLFGHARWEKTPAQIDLVLQRLAPEPGSRVLDLCCGPGRHSLELARRGFQVTGVDRTERYLEEARAHAAGEGLSIEFVQEDMRTFRRPDRFDAAINLFTSFGYFEDPADDLLVAQNVLASLRPGGTFVMDLLGREIIARDFSERSWSWVDEEPGAIFLEERKLANDWSLIENTWILVRRGEIVRRTFSLRLYTGTDLASLLHRAGFSGVTVFGGLDGSPYDQNVRRLVIVAVK